MNDKVFIDTNILIYSIDDSDILKQQRAKNAIIRIRNGRSIFLAYQYYSAPLTFSGELW